MQEHLCGVLRTCVEREERIKCYPVVAESKFWGNKFENTKTTLTVSFRVLCGGAHLPLLSGLGNWRQEDQEFANLGYVRS